MEYSVYELRKTYSELSVCMFVTLSSSNATKKKRKKPTLLRRQGLKSWTAGFAWSQGMSPSLLL